jgi:aldehyde dehydrogenase (NAD+)
MKVLAPDGTLLGEVGEGNRKDIRNAVEAAHAAAGSWRAATGHARAQILYYLAENLASRADDFAVLVDRMAGVGDKAARAEVEASVSRLFTYGAWADKYDGAVHNVPIRGVALAMNEPVGVMGIICPDATPLLSMISLIAPVMAMGNPSIMVPSAAHALAATELYTVLETSDVPKGVINIVTGPQTALATTLSEHDDVDGIWYFGAADGIAAVEKASAANMKRTWTAADPRDWFDVRVGEGREFLRHATEVKNIWVPYGE